MMDSHTAENLATDFESTLSEWKLKKECVTVTTDNTANILSAMDKCGLRHFGCMAHTLNLATQKALQIASISKVCGKIRKLMTFFRRSTLAANVLRKVLEQLELPVLKPIVDVVTRWNSTLDMIERYMKIRPAIVVALTNPTVKSQHEALNDREITLMGQLVQVNKTCINY